VGALVGNSQALQALFRLKSNLDSGHFRPILDAAVAAMQGDQTWIAERNRIYQQRRDLVLQAAQRMGLEARVPQAAIYVWAQVPPGWSDLDFTASVLEQVSVSLTPGRIFGAAGERAVRIALTTPTQRLQVAMQRLLDWQG
jgi:LL-diaminopimelate aminotransferase